MANEQEVKGLQLEERESEGKKITFVMGFEKWVGNVGRSGGSPETRV